MRAKQDFEDVVTDEAAHERQRGRRPALDASAAVSATRIDSSRVSDGVHPRTASGQNHSATGQWQAMRSASDA